MTWKIEIFSFTEIAELRDFQSRKWPNYEIVSQVTLPDLAGYR
jgi:hypothetical protein